jgi:hypothetical protein
MGQPAQNPWEMLSQDPTRPTQSHSLMPTQDPTSPTRAQPPTKPHRQMPIGLT